MNVSPKQCFRVALQVIGILTIINGICSAFSSWAYVVASLHTVEFHQPWSWMVGNIGTPIVMLMAGAFLLFGTRNLVNKTYPNEDKRLDSDVKLFDLALKIAGTVLIVQNLPQVVQILANLIFIYVLGANPIMDTERQIDLIIGRVFSTTIFVIFGWYLLRGGKWFARIAFPGELDAPKEGQEEQSEL